ncbi:MAG: aminotransferase class V-fold PLP-dependent enzyme [Gammaproteobacteria bacterium]
MEQTTDSIDITQVRADTPAVQQRLHLNNAGAALMPASVVAAVADHIQLEARLGGYEAAAEMASSIDSVYDEVAALIGARRDEIALLDNATAAWDQAFYALEFKPGDRILTAQAEYAANYVAFLQRAHRDGVIIDVIPNDENGAVDVTALENMLDERVALIAITWIPTNGGLVNPAQAIGQIARRYNIPYLLDACQAVGQMPVDVHELGCDFLSATGRKFLRGPRGTGFLYVRKTWLETLEPAMLDHFAATWVTRDTYALRPDARRFENWENAYALRLGLGEAVRYTRHIGLPAIQQRAWALADYLRDSLATLPQTRHYDLGAERCAIVSFSVAGLDPNQAQLALRQQDINISVIPPSSTRLDTEARQLSPLMRASPHYYNTRDEIDRFITVLDTLLCN